MTASHSSESDRPDYGLTLAVMGGYSKEYIRWVDPYVGRWSESFEDVDAAWAWRRRVGDAQLLVEDIAPDVSWRDYAEIAHSTDARDWHRLVRHVCAQQMRDAITQYTHERLADGESLSARAFRLLGRSQAQRLGFWKSSAVQRVFRTLDARRTVTVLGREWVCREPSAGIVLLEASRGAPFSERRLRSVLRHDDV